ncbi:MAG: sulfatase-like hydrolase/transferase [Clostridia bacterium]|nr:sulfatase-like hydrolase/transferase [Clostridia bacterium]
MKKPNVLFIVTDDQRFDTIRALGNEEISTPNLDRLVHRGMSFTNAHIAGGTCGAVCMPSRAMIMTGRNPFRLEELGGNIPPEQKTLAETFRQNGYETIGLGKWHNGCPAYARSFTQGAKIFFGGMWDHWNVPTCRYDQTGEYDNVINFVVDFYSENKTQKIHCDEFEPGKHSSELLTDAAIDLLRKNSGKDKPFFLYLAYLAPHDPRTMPDHFRKMYKAEDITLPENFREVIETNYPLMVHRDEHLAAYPRNPDEIREQIADYYAMITHLDYEIGRLLDALNESGEEENTIIVFTGDNGLALGQHGWMGKEDIYEHGVRIPLIFSGPGIPENETDDSFVYLFDVFPTLCGLTGIEVPSSVEGKSFAPLLRKDNGFKAREELYIIFDEYVRGIKDREFKLIEYRNGDSEEDKWTFLYNLREDPNETVNLANNPEYKEKIIQMRKRMLTMREAWREREHPWGVSFWTRFRPETDNL